MKKNIKPFKFKPYLKTVLWGGERIAPFKGIDTDLHNIGESWEISGVEGHVSVVAEGPDQGKSLVDLIDCYGLDLVGEKVYKHYGRKFPLLIKIIDAQRDLSVQVHPGDELAMQRHHSLGKTEMWYVIDAKPGAVIHAGLSQPLTPEIYEKRVAEKSIMEVVAHHESHAGDVYVLPAGRIHAIGAGNLLAEIQETSDITYRVYDFDRRDKDGNLRQLHTEQARDAIDYTVYDSYCTPYDRQARGLVDLVDCPYFNVKRLMADGCINMALPQPHSFVILMCIDGAATATDFYGNVTTMRRGETVLVPALASMLALEGTATLLTIQVD